MMRIKGSAYALERGGSLRKMEVSRRALNAQGIMSFLLQVGMGVLNAQQIMISLIQDLVAFLQIMLLKLLRLTPLYLLSKLNTDLLRLVLTNSREYL